MRQLLDQVRTWPLPILVGIGVVAVVALVVTVLWVQGTPGSNEADTAPDTRISAETTLLLADVRRTMDRLQQLERVQEEDDGTCPRCVVLSDLVTHFEDEVQTGIETLRALEHGQLAEGALTQRADPDLVNRQRQTVANRLAALDQFGGAALQCGRERLCRRDDARREDQTMPFDCARDRQSLREAAARITALSQTIILEARRCRRMTCPVMSCEGASALVADLAVAERSLAQLAGGQIALHQAAQDPGPGGLVVIIGQLERAIARLVRDSGEGRWPTSELARQTGELGGALSGWLMEQEALGALPRDGWRASALLAELGVASERMNGEPLFAVSSDTYKALAAALLDAIRFQAAIANRATQGPIVDQSGPVCGVDELASAYLEVGRAQSAVRFCQQKVACPVSAPDAFGSQGRSASAPEIGAFAAITGALPLNPERSNTVRVRESEAPRLTTGRNRYQVGEVISVRVDPTPSACLREQGVIALQPLSRPGDTQSYQVTGTGETDLMFGASEQAGEYVLRVYADADRGGVLLEEAGLSIEPARPGCTGFSGLWETNFGRLRLVERDGKVTGSYRRTADVPLPGIVLGDVSGRTLQGTWMSELGRGGTRLRLAADGNSFSGTWGTRPERHDGAGAWRGTCLGAAH